MFKFIYLILFLSFNWVKSSEKSFFLKEKKNTKHATSSASTLSKSNSKDINETKYKYWSIGDPVLQYDTNKQRVVDLHLPVVRCGAQ